MKILSMCLPALALFCAITAKAENAATGFGTRQELNRKAIVEIAERMNVLEAERRQCAPRAAVDATARRRLSLLEAEIEKLKSKLATQGCPTPIDVEEGFFADPNRVLMECLKNNRAGLDKVTPVTAAGTGMINTKVHGLVEYTVGPTSTTPGAILKIDTRPQPLSDAQVIAGTFVQAGAASRRNVFVDSLRLEEQNLQPYEHLGFPGAVAMVLGGAVVGGVWKAATADDGETKVDEDGTVRDEDPNTFKEFGIGAGYGALAGLVGYGITELVILGINNSRENERNRLRVLIMAAEGGGGAGLAGSF